MSEGLNEITGWELTIVPSNVFLRVIADEKDADVKINFQTHLAIGGIKKAPYVNVAVKKSGDERHYYESKTNDWTQPYIALRLNEATVKHVERYALSHNPYLIYLSIRIQTRDIVESKMFFTGDIEFNYVARALL